MDSMQHRGYSMDSMEKPWTPWKCHGYTTDCPWSQHSLADVAKEHSGGQMADCVLTHMGHLTTEMQNVYQDLQNCTLIQIWIVL
jgi:hypothetical protein